MVGARGLWRERWVYVQRFWEYSCSAPVTALVSVCFMQWVLPGPSSLPVPHSVYTDLLPLKSVSDFPITLKNKIKSRLHFPFVSVWSDPCLSFVNILYHPLPHPESSSRLGSSLFSNPSGSFLMQSCWIPLISHNPIYVLFSTYVTVWNHLIYFVHCVCLCF